MHQERINKRANDLFKIGLNYDFKEHSYIGQSDIIRDFNVGTDEIINLSDREWAELINKLKEEKGKREKNKTLKEEKINDIIEEMGWNNNRLAGKIISICNNPVPSDEEKKQSIKAILNENITRFLLELADKDCKIVLKK